MSLRRILLLLAFLAFLSASVGGFSYFSSLRMSLYKEAETGAALRSTEITNRLASFLTAQLKPVRLLAGLPAIRRAVLSADEESLTTASGLLDHFKDGLGVDVCYVMNKAGDTILSSNRMESDSFVGRNFSFRPYFQEAIRGRSSSYMALGTASGKRGVYFSYPVFGDDARVPLGVAVIKSSIEFIEEEISQASEEAVLLVDPHGIIFISTVPSWLFHTLWEVSPATLKDIAATRQFGGGPWEWTGLSAADENLVVDQGGQQYLFYQQESGNFPGWKIVYLRNARSSLANMYNPLFTVTGSLVFLSLILVVISVFILYKKAFSEIVRRRTAESALRESEIRYRGLYHNTPALLHSIDVQGRMVSVSDHWAEVLGYSRREAMGRKVTDFMTPASRKRAEDVVIPKFLATGFCKDIPYQFVKKNGEIIDVLLSAIAEHDAAGKIRRSLAVLLDVTEQKRIEKRLKAVTEELSHYSRDLERQVRERTLEVSNILKYTPAMVYLKDREGHYLLVNSRFEEIFSVRQSEIRGKTDHDIFPSSIAEQFVTHDRQVLADNQSLQIEESVTLGDTTHVYLSVKFPLYDEKGMVNGVGGISTDITDLKKAQGQLRRLSASIMASQEKERAAIARELHDELGQVLTALRIDSVWLHDHLKEKDAKAAVRALTMCELIDQTIDEVRSLAVRLRPRILDDLGLIAALEWLTADFEKRTDMLCTFKHVDVPRLSDTENTAIYRIIQEALTNAARHSGAGHVDVVLKYAAIEGAAVLSLSITDDGRGYDYRELNESEGMGMAGIHERASLIGASLKIRAQPGVGTRLSLQLPLGRAGRDYLVEKGGER